MSQPVLPAPTTSTRRPRNCDESLYAEAWITVPVKPAIPSYAGILGAQLCPLATTTAAYRVVRSPPPMPVLRPVLRVVTSHLSPAGVTRTTSVPSQMCGRRSKWSA
jgi:hypothetical protein